MVRVVVSSRSYPCPYPVVATVVVSSCYGEGNLGVLYFLLCVSWKATETAMLLSPDQGGLVLVLEMCRLTFPTERLSCTDRRPCQYRHSARPQSLVREKGREKGQPTHLRFKLFQGKTNVFPIFCQVIFWYKIVSSRPMSEFSETCSDAGWLHANFPGRPG